MSRQMICPCEDVTTTEVDHAIDKGFCDVESVKRYTGFGTGMCQGKQCVAAVASYVQKKAKLSPDAVVAFTPRPPMFPTAMSQWASVPYDSALPPTGGVPPSLSFSTRALRKETPVKERARIVVVGGGIMGLALAHNLAQRGESDIVVLEKGYLCAGASGRNGGGVRMQWGTKTNIELAKRSIALMKGFAREMGINVWLRQGGYLFLAKSADVARRLEQSAALHNQHGVRTEILDARGAQKIVGELNTDGVTLAAYNKDDGVIFPWPFVWGYAQAAEKRGVVVEPFTRVTGFETSAGAIRAVQTDRGRVACDQVVLAAGAWSPEVARLLGVSMPNQPHRHEICSTEPLKPFLGPLVSVLDSGLYFSQSMRGEIVGGMGNPDEPHGMQLGSSMAFLSRYSRAMTELIPRLGHIKILRQWSGPYDVTPDNSPILGFDPTFKNLLHMSGFVGHGFMMAPAVAERMAAWMMTPDNGDELFSRFVLSRFAEGRLEKEHMIIG